MFNVVQLNAPHSAKKTPKIRSQKRFTKVLRKIIFLAFWQCRNDDYYSIYLKYYQFFFRSLSHLYTLKG